MLISLKNIAAPKNKKETTIKYKSAFKIIITNCPFTSNETPEHISADKSVMLKYTTCLFQ